jgi:hypothetical protein
MKVYMKLAGLIALLASTAGILAAPAQTSDSMITQKILGNAKKSGNAPAYFEKLIKEWAGVAIMQKSIAQAKEVHAKEVLEAQTPPPPTSGIPAKKIPPTPAPSNLQTATLEKDWNTLLEALAAGRVADSVNLINTLSKNKQGLSAWLDSDKQDKNCFNLMRAAFVGKKQAQQSNNSFDPLVSPLAKLYLEIMPARAMASLLIFLWKEGARGVTRSRLFALRFIARVLELDCKSPNPVFFGPESLKVIHSKENVLFETQNSWYGDGAFKKFLGGIHDSGRGAKTYMFKILSDYPSVAGIDGIVAVQGSDGTSATPYLNLDFSGCPRLRDINYTEAQATLDKVQM